MARRLRVLAVSLLVVVGVSGVQPSVPASHSVPDPTVSGPVGTAGLRGHALWDSWFDLAAYGYEEDEYFVSGNATNATSGATAPYTTRIIVTRPADPDDFNGTVLLDWVNVTAQFENAVDSLEAQEYLLRDGWALVHVSAQSAGICCNPLTPKVWDPVRYATLSHPGDAFAYSMFSQVAKAVKSPTGVDPLDGLPGARYLVAAGQSQSASRLDTYVRNAQADADVIDGFLIHGGGSKAYTAPPAAPVLHLLSDAEAAVAAPTHDGDNYRLWEVAGSAHADFWIGYQQEFGQGPRTLADAPQQSQADREAITATAGNYGEQPHPMHGTCILAGTAFPMRYSVSAALDHVKAWVRPDGPVPPAGPRFAFSGTTLARDTDGNALGGIRLAPIDVPVARYVSTTCGLGGITVPFTEAELLLRYPTHAAYYGAVAARVADNVADGYLLPEDAADLLARACDAKNRWGDLSGSDC